MGHDTVIISFVFIVNNDLVDFRLKSIYIFVCYCCFTHLQNITDMAEEYSTKLTQLVEQSDLEGAAVFCKEDGSLATAGNFAVRSSDVSHILRTLQSDAEQGAVFPVNGRMHEVKVHHPGSSLYAEEMPGGKHQSAIWVIDTERHLVLGAGIGAMALACEESIDEFAVELAG